MLSTESTIPEITLRPGMSLQGAFSAAGVEPNVRKSLVYSLFKILFYVQVIVINNYNYIRYDTNSSSSSSNSSSGSSSSSSLSSSSSSSSSSS